LAVEAKPREAELEPGGSTTVDLVVRDADGRAVEGAEALVIVVDEAILALAGYRLPDPLGVFYPERHHGVSTTRLRSHAILAELRDLLALQKHKGAGPAGGVLMEAEAGAAPPAPAMARARGGELAFGDEGAADAAANGEAQAIKLRKDLSALALF